jgi:Ca2+-dependent lipid-binding protein
VITKADIDSSKSWDTLVYTEPDPYVTVTVGSTSGSTSVINNTYTPQWDEYLFSVPASEILKNGLSVEVYDDDVVTADQLMGACSVTVPESVLLAGGGVAKDCGTAGDVKELHFQFTN